MSIVAGTKLRRYEIRSKIGEGGMGEVYRAYDATMHREVAIKVLPAALSTDKERLARFEQEAQTAGALNHPNILVIFHIDTHDSAPYIVSELLEGETLRERMGGVVLPQRKAIDYALPMRLISTLFGRLMAAASFGPRIVGVSISSFKSSRAASDRKNCCSSPMSVYIPP